MAELKTQPTKSSVLDFLNSVENKKKRADSFEILELMCASIGLENPDDFIADLDQALNSRTVKGALGPLVYRLVKKFSG